MSQEAAQSQICSEDNRFVKTVSFNQKRAPEAQNLSERPARPQKRRQEITDDVEELWDNLPI